MRFWTRTKQRPKVRRTRSPLQAVLERLEDRTLLAAPLVKPIPDQVVTVGMGFTLPVTSADADSDEINLSASLANGGVFPSWLTFTPGPLGSGTGTFTSTGTVGSLDVRVTVTDENGESGTDTFTILATDGVLMEDVEIPDLEVGVHTALTFPVPANAFTSNGNALTLSATTDLGDALPAWLTFTPGAAATTPTGTFTGTPVDADVSATNVKLTAFDTVTGATAIQLFTISVPLNHTPQFTKGADQSVNEGDVVAPAVGWATNIVKGPPLRRRPDVDLPGGRRQTRVVQHPAGGFRNRNSDIHAGSRCRGSRHRHGAVDGQRR